MKRKRILIAFVIAVLCALCVAPTANATTARPSQVKGVTVKATNSTSIRVTWKVPSRANGYKLRYSKKSSMAGAKTITVTGSATRAKALKGLSICTRYYVQVRAYGAGLRLGKWSVKHSVKTSHVYRQVAAASATCTTAAHSAYKVCRKCGLTVGKKITKAALGHANKGICTRCKEVSYTWAQLKTISNKIGACATEEAALEMAKSYGLLASDGKLTGNEVKSFTLTNGVKCKAQILGFWHDTKASGGKAGITFGFKGIAAKHAMNSTPVNRGGWKASKMRTWLNSTFYNRLPAALKSQIVAVKKKTNNNVATKAVSAVTATSDKLWLLGQTECFGTSYTDYVQTNWIDTSAEETAVYASMFAAEGTQYQLYADKGVTVDNYSFLAKYDTSGQKCDWWLRSPLTYESQRFFSISNWGWSTSNSSDINGVSPAFCL